MRRGGLLIAVRTQQEREPALASADEGSFDLVARGLQHGLQLAQGDLLFVLVPRDRVGLHAQVGLELLVGAEQFKALLVESRGSLSVKLAELVAVPIVRQNRKLRDSRPQRQLLSLE